MRRAVRITARVVIAFMLLAFVAGLWPTLHHWDPDNEFRSRFTGHWQYFEANPRWTEPEPEHGLGFDG